MRIVLFRHGIAIDRDDPDSPVEQDRFLTGRGIERTRAAAAGLVQLGLAPQRMLSSPWLRAQQTAEIAAEALGFDAGRIEVTEALLPFAPVSSLLEEAFGPGAQEILVAGHAPHLDDFLSSLTGSRAIRLKKAGAACVEIPEARPGSGRLEWLMSPRALRELGRGEPR